jgi:hypothetical protein
MDIFFLLLERSNFFGGSFFTISSSGTGTLLELELATGAFEVTPRWAL